MDAGEREVRSAVTLRERCAARRELWTIHASGNDDEDEEEEVVPEEEDMLIVVNYQHGLLL